MGKKIKQQKQIIDPQLEDVGEERAFETEFDEETNEVVIIHHYRRQWGDEFDADIEQLLNIEENTELISILMEYLGEQKKRLMLQAVEQGLIVGKSTPEVKESNPMEHGEKVQNMIRVEKKKEEDK